MTARARLRLGILCLTAGSVAFAIACGEDDVTVAATPDAGLPPPALPPPPSQVQEPPAMPPAPPTAPPLVTCGVEPCVTQLSAGYRFACGVLDDGTVSCWGLNTQGALGRQLPGDAGSTHVPGRVEGLSGAVQVAAGFYHACALREDGKVSCWGSTNLGQLGEAADASAGIVLRALEVPGLPTGIARIHAGGYFTCAHLVDKRVFCWGDAAHGNLGGTADDAGGFRPEIVTTPIEQVDLGTPDAINVGDRYICARSGTSLTCRGGNALGQLGRGDAGRESSRDLEPVVGLSSVSTIFESEAYHSCVIADRKVMCWGSNFGGQTGVSPEAGPYSLVPVEVPGLGDVVEIGTGGVQTCALAASGTVRCWGSNLEGAVGISPDAGTVVPSPVEVAGLEDVVTLAIGHESSCALLKTGAVMCFGPNREGALGRPRDGGTPDWTPARVEF